MRGDLVKEALKVVRSERFVHARKLARKLGISTKSAGRVLHQLKEEGVLRLWVNRRGRFKVYVVE